jgi:nucleotide-binding universal stress UspA family protein
MKILVAVDGSPSSLAALDALVARLSLFRDPPLLVLAYVHLPIPYPGAVHWVGKEAVEKYYQDEGLAALKPAEERLASHGIAFEHAILTGDPAHELTRHASASGCDMIAMGARGHTALANLVLGSTATKVLAVATLPVLFPR